jgi:hypothetical protein
MEALFVLIFGFSVYYLLKGACYFIRALYRFLQPIFIMAVFGVDSAFESEIKRSKEYKDFEDEINKML